MPAVPAQCPLRWAQTRIRWRGNPDGRAPKGVIPQAVQSGGIDPRSGGIDWNLCSARKRDNGTEKNEGRNRGGLDANGQ